MNLPVKLNKKRQIAKIVFAEARDFSFLKKWKDQLGNNAHPYRVDSVAFAHLAHSRYTSHSATTPYVCASDEFKTYINDNPKREIGCLVLLTCDWFPDSDVLGLCHFRRTWCNHIVLDYLCAHPFITAPTVNSKHFVKGVGLALLFFVTEIAKQCRSKLLWGEATQNSCKYYKDAFKLPLVKDLIYIPPKKIDRFYAKLKKGWADEEKSKTSAIIEEFHAIELKNPPFVGTKTNVFIPPKQSIQNLLELPRHVKLEVAQALEASDQIKSCMSDAEVVRNIIEVATKNDTLGKLWREVAKRSKRTE
jgi:hypothetical protein